MDKKRKENCERSTNEELAHLLDELELTQKQREFVELMNDEATQYENRGDQRQ